MFFFECFKTKLLLRERGGRQAEMGRRRQEGRDGVGGGGGREAGSMAEWSGCRT